MRKLRHIIRLNIEDHKGDKRQILESGFMSLPKKLLQKLFGEGSLVYILRPDESVDTVELVRRKSTENDTKDTKGKEKP